MIQQKSLERKLDSIYSGRYEVRIDEKGRLAIPKDFRTVVERRTSTTSVFTVRADRNKHPYIAVYDARIFLKLNELNESLVSGESVRLQWDKQGRIVIPPFFRDYADIKEAAVVFGAPALTHFEIWTIEYQEYYGQILADHSE